MPSTLLNGYDQVRDAKDLAKLLRSESDVEQVVVCHSADFDSCYLSMDKATKICISKIHVLSLLFLRI